MTKVARVLEDIKTKAAGEAVFLCTGDGSILEAASDAGLNLTAIAMYAASYVSVSHRMGEDTHHGTTEGVVVLYRGKALVIAPLGNSVVAVVVGSRTTHLGNLRHQLYKGLDDLGQAVHEEMPELAVEGSGQPAPARQERADRPPQATIPPPPPVVQSPPPVPARPVTQTPPPASAKPVAPAPPVPLNPTVVRKWPVAPVPPVDSKAPMTGAPPAAAPANPPPAGRPRQVVYRSSPYRHRPEPSATPQEEGAVRKPPEAHEVPASPPQSDQISPHTDVAPAPPPPELAAPQAVDESSVHVETIPMPATPSETKSEEAPAPEVAPSAEAPEETAPQASAPVSPPERAAIAMPVEPAPVHEELAPAREELPPSAAVASRTKAHAFAARINEALTHLRRPPGVCSVAVLALEGLGETTPPLPRPDRERLIQRCAEQLQKALRAADVAADFENGLFGLLLAGVKSDQANAVVQRITTQVLEKNLDSPPAEVTFRLRAGIAAFPEAGATGEQLLRRATTGLFLSRIEGAIDATRARPAEFSVAVIVLEGVERVASSTRTPAWAHGIPLFASRLETTLRVSDISTQLDDIKYGLLLMGVNQAQAKGIVQRIRDQVVKDNLECPRSEITFRVRAGIATFPDAGPSADSLLYHAEATLEVVAL